MAGGEADAGSPNGIKMPKRKRGGSAETRVSWFGRSRRPSLRSERVYLAHGHPRPSTRFAGPSLRCGPLGDCRGRPCGKPLRASRRLALVQREQARRLGRCSVVAKNRYRKLESTERRAGSRASTMRGKTEESKMKTTDRTVVGVDTAKRVFQLHWVDVETGEVVDLRLTRAKFMEHFANRAPCLVGMEACGGAQHWARRLLERPRCPSAAGENCPAVRQRQQERHARRSGDLDCSSAARGEDGGREKRRAASGPGAASHAPAIGEVPHRPDQRPARPVDRIRRSHAARPSRDEAGHGRGP